MWALNHVGIWGSTVPSRRNCICKGPEAESFLAYLKNEEANMNTVKRRWVGLVENGIIKIIS